MESRMREIVDGVAMRENVKPVDEENHLQTPPIKRRSGAYRDRTDDLLNAIEALYQLS